MGTYVNNNKVGLGASYNLSEATKEIAALVGVTARADGKIHLADVCQAASIKRYARYKPEDYNTQANLTAAQRAENHYGFNKTTPYFTAGGSTEPHATYEYIKPKGGMTSLNRIRDLDGYYHKAVSPLNLQFPSDLFVDWANGIVLKANDTAVTNYNTTDCVKLGEVMGASNDLYVALYIYKDGNNQWLLPTNVKVNDLSSSTFPQVVFAADSSELSTQTGNYYPYLIPEIAGYEDEELTLIAVAVNGLTYQTDKAPYKLSGSKLIGNRYLYSMELESNKDRATIVMSKAKTVSTLIYNSFTASLGTASKHSTVGGYQAYTFSGVTSSLKVTTPAVWYYHNGEKIYIEASIINQNGSIYTLSGTTAQSLVLGGSYAIDTASKQYTITDLLSTIGNYRFTNNAGTSVKTMGINITIKAYTPDKSESKTLYTGTTYVTLP